MWIVDTGLVSALSATLYAVLQYALNYEGDGPSDEARSKPEACLSETC